MNYYKLDLKEDKNPETFYVCEFIEGVVFYSLQNSQYNGAQVKTSLKGRALMALISIQRKFKDISITREEFERNLPKPFSTANEEEKENIELLNLSYEMGIVADEIQKEIEQDEQQMEDILNKAKNIIK